MKDADLFTPDRPRRDPMAVAQSRTVDLQGRAQLRLLLIEDEHGDRRILLGRGWEGDPMFQVPTVLIPVEAVPALREALEALEGQA
jgi:hypothetical protein